jgi:hypothetical protein
MTGKRELANLEEELDIRFKYHSPKGDQPARYEEISATARKLAEVVFGLAPRSRERDLAIARIEEAVMWANAAIARRG